jgi:hypothetical protein
VRWQAIAVSILACGHDAASNGNAGEASKIQIVVMDNKRLI